MQSYEGSASAWARTRTRSELLLRLKGLRDVIFEKQSFLVDL